MIGIGTRYSDFTTASRTAFQNPDVRFVNINVASFDAVKQGGLRRVGRRPRSARSAVRALGGYTRRATTYRPAQPSWRGVGRDRAAAYRRRGRRQRR